MKKTVAIVLCAVLSLSLLACSSKAPETTPEPEETTPVEETQENEEPEAEPVETAGAEIAREDLGANPQKTEYYFVFIPKLVHPFYEPIKQGFEDAVAEYAEKGITIVWDWDAPAAADAVLQTEKIEAAVTKAPDAIGIAVQEPAVIDPIVQEVEDAGTPVVLFADDTSSGSGSAFVGIKDLVGTGEVMGELLAESIGYEGEVGILLGSLAAQSHIERAEGIKNALAKYPDIKIVSEVASDDDLEKAVQESERMLAANPNLKAIISADGSGAAGAARAIVDSGKKGEVLSFGFDDIDENIAGIRDGSIVATYAQDAYATGYYTMKAMIEVADGTITNANKLSIESDNRLLTIDTLDQYGY